MAQQEQTIIDYFSSLKKHQQLGSSYLFLGENNPLVEKIICLLGCSQPNACGKCWDCEAFRGLTHPDLMIVASPNVVITVDQMRAAQKFLSMKSFRAVRKILLIKDAQNLNDVAANAFLKTLEEPPANCVILIAANSLEGILPTIISRCRKIFLPPLIQPGFDVKPELFKGFFAGEKVKFTNRKQFLQFLLIFSALLRDRMAALAGGNNRLLGSNDYEIILRSQGMETWSIDKTSRILEKTLAMQAVYNSVNENLALNLIRMEIL